MNEPIEIDPKWTADEIKGHLTSLVTSLDALQAQAVPAAVTYTNPVADRAEALARKYSDALVDTGSVIRAVTPDDFAELAELVAKMARAIR